MGSFGQVVHTKVEDLLFRIYTDEEIKRISVLEITNDQSINELGHVSQDGVYDLRLGPMSERQRDLCETCKQSGYRCQGHCGHINLPVPVYNPLFYSVIKKILSVMCTSCYRIQTEGYEVIKLLYQMRLLDEGYGQETLELADLVHQVIAASKEAEEVVTGVEGRDIRTTNYGKLKVITRLEMKVKEYCKQVIKGGTCSSDTSTSNIKALQIQIFKNFMLASRCKTYCIFCEHSIMKLSFQGSRLMKNSFSTSRVKKKKIGKQNQNVKEEEEEDEEEEAKSATVEFIADSQSYITTEQARTMLWECWKKNKKVLECLYPVLRSSKLPHPTDMFFMNTLLVMPPKLRPCNTLDGVMIEHETSTLLKGVVRMSKALSFLMSLVKGKMTDLPEALQYILSEVPGKTPIEKTQTVWYQLQGFIDNLLDANMNKIVKSTSKGVRQVIEKKTGLFRSNLMGKRVNYSARSVAAPDPQLAVDEVGVPMDFALKLSYPVPVTQWNVEELRQLVMNGPDVYPGAVMVEDEEGKKKRLFSMSAIQRAAVANKLLTPQESHVRRINATKIVYRHLINGDFVLMNRQPTLHRPSIQAHRARVMPNDRVLRLPYASCKAYNADFDGDELNLHFPQNEIARSEARHIITTRNQYLTPKDGSPLAGLIQDCVVASVMLTVRGRFFSREDYQQLIVTGLSDQTGRIKMPPPAILKPQQLWSGKQVISTLFLNLIPQNKTRPSFAFKTSVKVDLWQTEKAREWRGGGVAEKRREAMTDSEFVMRDGELLSGVVDKSAIGSTSHGLVHICYDLYGGEVASQLLTSINRLCVYYLKWIGHTISVKEFVTPGRISAKRRNALADLVKRAPREVSHKLGIPEEMFRDHFEQVHMSQNHKELAAIDAAYTSVLGPTTSEVTGENERGMLRRGLDNHMRMMVDTGAKGSKVNMNQMVSLFGSVAIDGKRMPMSITGKFLPSFLPYDSNPRAGGYIPNRFMTGMSPQSYFYLCIVGRDSLQHTAVKTADSGYLQRCLIKHLEGIHVKYDMTVRNSDGLVLQFDYGEDGLDVTKTPFLRTNQTLEVLVTNYPCLLDPKSLSIARSVGERNLVEKYAGKLAKWHKKNTKAGRTRRSGFLKFSRKVGPSLATSGFSSKTGRTKTSMILQDKWQSLGPEEKAKYSKDCGKCPDPVKSMFSGASNLGVVTEAVDALIDQYYQDHYSKKREHEQKLTREEVSTAVHMKVLNSMVDPGEAVGALCAQAIGEPLTQMTLNTFHFAGRDELNVTLGVPRMVEVLRSATRSISTPIMEVPFHPHVTKAQAESLRIVLSQVSLHQVLHSLHVTVQLARSKLGKLHRCTRIRLAFLPYSEYRYSFAVNPQQILAFTETHFLPKVLLKEIKKSFKQSVTRMCSYSVDKFKKQQWSQQQQKVEEEAEGTSESPGQDTSEQAGATQSVKDEVDDDDDDDDDDNEANEDADATSSKRNRKRQEQDYSEDEDAEDEDDDNADVKREVLSEDEGIEEDRMYSDEEAAAQVAVRRCRGKAKKKVSQDEMQRRKELLLEKDSWIIDYSFDQKKQLWCEMVLGLPITGGNYDIHSLVQQKSQEALVHNVKNLRRVFVVDKNQKLMLRTEGVNILKMFEYEHLLDIHKLYTNNIHHVAELYGIEAAQRSVIRELRAVQSAYDIKVDFRHLSLLADYFTCEGVYKACSRQALASCLSPLQKMSYETCTEFLKSALLKGEGDHMTSPTANIAVGQPVKLGTNSMHILPVNFS